MIKKLKYQEIDFEKYTKCVENSVQKNFYAQKKVLDVLCDDWEILIKGDYDFVMPIPVKKKYSFSFVLMPLFCQQLGVFGNENDSETEQQFLDFLTKNYRIFTYHFNEHNAFNANLSERKNYFIPKTEYSLLRKHYFKGRKSTVKTAQYLSYKELQLEECTAFIKKNRKGLDKEKEIEKFFQYLQFLQENSALRLFGSFKEEIHLTNLAMVIETEDCFSLLGLINDENYKLDNGASFLVDKILKENIHEKSFDFMGGSIRGIEVFFKSFGSQLRPYAVIENTKKDLLKNFFKK